MINVEITRGNKKVKLFIIEDNPDECEIFEEFFRYSKNIELCGISSDGLDGIEKIKKNKPDVILSDFIIPNIDGLGILKLLRREFLNRLKIIIISSVGSNKVAERAFESGADYYIKKPVDLEYLSNVILSVVEDNTNVLLSSNINLNRIKKCLIDLGIPINCVGYNCILKAVNSMMFSNKVMTLKEIYQFISDDIGISTDCVEAGIRNAIRKAYNLNNDFYRSVFSQDKCPSNSIFLNVFKEFISINLY